MKLQLVLKILILFNIMIQAQRQSEKNHQLQSHIQAQIKSKKGSVRKQNSVKNSQRKQTVQQNAIKTKPEKSQRKSQYKSVNAKQKSISQIQWDTNYQNQVFDLKSKNKNANIAQSSQRKPKQQSELKWEAVYHNDIFHLGLLKKDQNINDPNGYIMDKSKKNQMYWEAAYIDEKFYLSDPASLARLRQLEDQIQAQRIKLAKIQSVQKFDQSFLSHQQFDEQFQNNKLDSLTEVNESKLLKRKQNAQADLIKQQQKYRNKLQQMKRKKSILKKQIGCGTNQKNFQVNQQQIKKQKQQILNAERKSNYKQSQRQKSKSKKIADQKQSSNLNNQQQKSPSINKQPSKKSSQQIQSPNIRIIEKKSQKTSKVPQKSVKNQQKTQKQVDQSRQQMKSQNQKSMGGQKVELDLLSPQKARSNKSRVLQSQKKQQIKIDAKSQRRSSKANKDEKFDAKSQRKSAQKQQASSKQINQKKSQRLVQRKQQTQSQKFSPSLKQQIKSNKQQEASPSVAKSKASKKPQYQSPSSVRSKQQSNIRQNNIQKSQKQQSDNLDHQNKSEIDKEQSSVRSKAKSKKQQILTHIKQSKIVDKQIQKSQKSMIEKSQKSMADKSQKSALEKSQKSAKDKSQNSQISSPSKSGNKQVQSQTTKKIQNPAQSPQNRLDVPEIKVNMKSFKKTDKSVQWQQIQPSVTKFQVQKSVQASIKDTFKQSRIKQKTQYSKVSQIKSKSQYSNNQSSSPKKNYKQIYHDASAINEQQQKNNVQAKQFQNSYISNGDHQSQNTKNYVQNNKSEVSKKPSSIRSKKYSSKEEEQIENKQVNKKAQNQIQNQNISHRSFNNTKTQKNIINQSDVLQKKSNNNISMSESQITSDKKRPTFKIHSRQSSVKSKKSHSKHKDQKILDIQQLQIHSNKKMGSIKNTQYSNGNQKSQQLRNQLQIKKLNDQIFQLQEKLKRVEQKQQQLFKFQNNQSRAISQNLQNSQPGSGSQCPSPLGKGSLQSRLKLQAKLSLQPSTVQFNTYEQKLKLTAEQNQKLQKLKLQQQIGRLKKVIRNMQMQKIKSIQIDPNENLSKVQIRRGSILDAQQNIQQKSRLSQKWKESLNSDMLQTKRQQWITQTFNKDKDDAGKIKKNSPSKFYIQSPRKYNKLNAQKCKQFSQDAKDQQKYQFPLPLRKKAESVHGNGTKSRDLTKSDLINKFQQNQKNFHQFLESSRMVGHQYQSYVQPANQSLPQAFQKKNQPLLPISKQTKQTNFTPNQFKKTVNRNFSEIIEKLKQQNPQDQIAIPSQIMVRQIQMPSLPQPPNLNMSQQDLLNLAKQTYKLFDINIQQDPNQLCMKKYKNCVVFTFGNNQQQTILWHYSGKFYFGGWKNTNDPGQGEKIGQGLQYIPGKHVYKGQFLGGKKNGNGIVKMSNGNIYDGQWVDGSKNGRGVYFQSSTGTYYSGQWKDGKRDGYGILKFSNNQFYQGTFSKSIKHGYGIQKFANGDYYKGQYQKGKFHGKGKYCWSNGSSYEGDFIQGCRHGQGNWKSSRKSGDLYTGGYQNDKKCGYGRYVWANGCIYQGYFKNDLKNGKGRLVYQDGKQIKGSWHEGNLISADQQARKMQQHEQEPLRRSIRASSLKNSPNPLSNSYRRAVL